MERAVVLAPGATIPGGAVERVYLGAEFCPWKFPPPDYLLDRFAELRARRLPLSLLTPVLPEPFLPAMRRTLDLLVPKMRPGDEIVFGDWGLTELVPPRPDGVTLVAGRALSAQKRGLFHWDGQLSEALTALRGHAFESAPTRELLARLGVERIELDNLLQGLSPLPEGLRGSLHLPWLMLASGRNCPFQPPGRPQCDRPGCGEGFMLRSERFEQPLYQAGNTQFLRNDHLPDALAELGVDRLVLHEVLPV